MWIPAGFWSQPSAWTAGSLVPCHGPSCAAWRTFQSVQAEYMLMRQMVRLSPGADYSMCKAQSLAKFN